MYTRSSIAQLAILFVVCCLSTFCNTVVAADTPKTDVKIPVYRIAKVDSQLAGNSLTLTLKGDSSPAYTVSERFAPFRVVVDVANAVIGDGSANSKVEVPKNPFASLSVSLLKDQQPVITRFEIKLADSHLYKVNRQGNDITIAITPAEAKAEVAPSTEAAAAPATPPVASEVPELTDLQVTTSPGETTVLIVASKPVEDFKTETLPGDKDKPARMFIDFANASIATLAREKEVGGVIARIRVAPRGPGARIVFDAVGPEIFEYQAVKTAAGVQVVVKDPKGAKPADPKMAQSASAAGGTGGAVSDATLDALIESSSSMLAKTPSSGGKTSGKSSQMAGLPDNFSFSGYTKEKISVDFYKIDIHNVFRLFRQVTDLNIIVDEAVTGTLTLALTDVPWDFALDIILNLMDLKKEERFNTIVIYPKKKEFIWPERAEDNLAVEANTEIIEEEALVIQQSASQPQEVVKAQEILRKAGAAEKNTNYEEAAQLYESAAALWPTNGKIHNHLATLYLVNLGMNAKAVHYAKASLALDPADSRAALYAAIASANMQRLEEAADFFSQSISGNPPMKEALISFAAFNENNNQYEAALKVLEKYNSHYGETVDTMIAKARLLDKLGRSEEAILQYKTILASGFALPVDLKKYITGRVAAGH